MKRYTLLLLLAMISVSSKAQPPNNAIFFGGAGDGAGYLAFSIASNSLFAGGPGDGAGIASNNASSNKLFSGGAGDGFANQSNNATSNTIFWGGIGDGFVNASNNAVSNNIFLGSMGDGMANNGNAAISNNIFIGGGGDGWNAVLFPMGPLPVKLLRFTAEYAGDAHLVKWITTEEINTHRFEVQHSANGSDFVTAGNVLPAGSPSTGASYSFTVQHPWTGNNFYRLKIVDLDGTVTYSSVVLLKNAGELKVVIYPNPAASLLYVRLPLVANVSTIPAVIYDASGRIVLQPLLKTGADNGIAVEQLAAGVYTLQCIISQQPFTFRFMKNK